MQQRPNIVVYFSDQQRWDTLGGYGQRLDVTPNLDALAADSAWAETRAHLAELLQCKMVQAGERPPEIRPFRAW